MTALHPRLTTVTIRAQIDSFLADVRHRRGVSENTVAAYRYDLTTAAQMLTGPLDAITTAQVESFLASRDEKASTNNRRIASLRRFFTWAVRQGVCADNPVADVEAKRDETRLPRPIDCTADLRALDAAIAATALPYRLIFTIVREPALAIRRCSQRYGLEKTEKDQSLERYKLGMHGVQTCGIFTAVEMTKPLPAQMSERGVSVKNHGLLMRSLSHANSSHARMPC